MKILKNIMLISGVMVLLGSGAVQAQTCTASPDCATLGYTKTAAECSDNGIKCPFGDKWSCPTKPVIACSIGFIYYSDNTCNAELIAGKTVLGLVVYVTDGGLHGQVMVTNSIGRTVWSIYSDDIPELPNYTSTESASRDFNSCSNTDKIVAYGDRSRYPAAWIARNYAPANAPETKGKWCLPAAGIMTSIGRNLFAVQAGLAKLGISDKNWGWSSSVYSYDKAWTAHFSNAGNLDISAKDYYNPYGSSYGSHFVRAVMEF